VILRWITRGVAGLCAMILCYMLTALAGGLIGNGHVARVGEYRVGLVIGPIHTDLLIPLTPAVRARFDFAATAGVPVAAGGAKWLLVGWGAREFYTTAGNYADISAHAVWTGVTGDDAVMRLDAIGDIDDFSQIPLVDLDAAQFAGLVEALATTFARDANGVPVAIAYPGFTATDRFYAAIGPFNIMRTCNVWVGETFAAAGIPFGRWTPTPFAVRAALWRFHSRA
jgi:uncharacterized protein (TIGR02117 family)